MEKVEKGQVNYYGDKDGRWAWICVWKRAAEKDGVWPALCQRKKCLGRWRTWSAYKPNPECIYAVLLPEKGEGK